MYSKEQLMKIEYFNNLLKSNKLEYIVDSLTGLINRKYILDYVKYLINNNVHFSLAIMDLDEFKHVNDIYGHIIGDLVLQQISKDLIQYVGDDAVCARYGGDEFLIIYLKNNDYNVLHDFYNGIFHNQTVLRKNFKYKDVDIFLTGTLGSASFPDDAKNFDDLFLMSDKTLYRGKQKGRNCYIIYVHEKHKDLQIKKMYKDDEATILFNLNNIFDSDNTFEQKLKEINDYLKDSLRLDKLYYINENNNYIDLDDYNILDNNVNISDIKFNNELFKTDYKGEVNRLSFGNLIEEEKISSILMTRIKANNNLYGYIMFALKRAANIWKNSDIAILMYLSKLIAIDNITK